MTTLIEALQLENGGVISLVGAGGKTSLLFRLAAELAEAGRRVITTTTTKILYPTAAQSRRVLVDADPHRLLERTVGAIEKHRHLTLAHPRPAVHPGKLAGLAPRLVDELWALGRFDCILVEADGAAGRPLKAPADYEPVICASTACVVGVVGVRVLGRPATEEWVFRLEHFCRVTGLTAGDPVDPRAVARLLLSPEGIFKGAPHGARRAVFLNLAGDDRLSATARKIVYQLEHDRRPQPLWRAVIGNGLDTPAVLEYHDLVDG